MLDVGFSEILLTSAIALIVLGPERLPKVARQVGNWLGRARLMARQLSEQLEREVSADELLKQQTRSSGGGPKKPQPDSVPPAPPAPLAPPPVVEPPSTVAPPIVEPPPTEAAAAPEAPRQSFVAGKLPYD
jgi:sec-independent protein translocase protein TatB